MPISEAMRAANRANAKASTGPRTAEGKRRARLNALKHGLSGKTARTAVLPGEDAAAFTALEADLAGRFRPEGDIERELVSEMAAALWRGRRAPAAEVAALVANADEDEFAEAPLAAALGAPGAVDILLRISRYEGQINRAFERARERLTALQQVRAAAARRAAATTAQPPARPSPATGAKPAAAAGPKPQFPAGNGFVSSNPPAPPPAPLARALLGSASSVALGQAPPRAA